MTLSPIALFVYNRPHHARKTLESLMANAEFSDSPLYVFCDGAKRKKDIPLVRETRELIRSYELDNATIIEREENMGLANSIITGVTELCNKYGRVIVVEDDLYLSPYFLKYMNTALDTYEEFDEVIHIPGYMFLSDVNCQVHFSTVPHLVRGGGRGKLRAETLFSEEVQEKQVISLYTSLLQK
ncbi:MAG: glycosyltransferase family A protein [Candidatus Marinimicrobia bacterium]|nr:glycosyltransferase family A protein [Candidatus Neomarinimicrobiota bacterium]